MAGTTHSFVNCVWRSHGPKPHFVWSLRVNSDLRFEEKLGDDVGLQLNPPDYAAVFRFDEKSPAQAWDRKRPGLPLKAGRCGATTHDYEGDGTTSLFVALDAVIGKMYRRHRHQEVAKFLRKVDATVPKGWEIHIILDDYAAHKRPRVLKWIERRKRIVRHFDIITIIEVTPSL